MLAVVALALVAALAVVLLAVVALEVLVITVVALKVVVLEVVALAGVILKYLEKYVTKTKSHSTTSKQTEYLDIYEQ